jgi:hypothetical protein
MNNPRNRKQRKTNMSDLRFSHRWLRSIPYSGIKRLVIRWKSTDVSEEIYLVPTSRWFLVWLIFRPWKWRWYVHPKRRLTFKGLHSIITQKTKIFRSNTVAIFELRIWSRHRNRQSLNMLSAQEPADEFFCTVYNWNKINIAYATYIFRKWTL